MFIGLLVQIEALVIYCKPEIRIGRNVNEADYVCQGGGIPPKGKFQRINVIPQREEVRDSVTHFRVIDKSLYFVPNVIFDSFRNMRNVVLSNVKIDDLDKKHFRNANALKFLQIQINNIPKLKAHLFASAPNIVNLKLPNNKIHFVHKQAFHGLHQIQEIALEDNKIKALSMGTFRPLNTLSDVKLSNNHCINNNYRSNHEVENDIPKTNCDTYYREYLQSA